MLFYKKEKFDFFPLTEFYVTKLGATLTPSITLCAKSRNKVSIKN